MPRGDAFQYFRVCACAVYTSERLGLHVNSVAPALVSRAIRTIYRYTQAIFCGGGLVQSVCACVKLPKIWVIRILAYTFSVLAS